MHQYMFIVEYVILVVLAKAVSGLCILESEIRKSYNFTTPQSEILHFWIHVLKTKYSLAHFQVSSSLNITSVTKDCRV